MSHFPKYLEAERSSTFNAAFAMARSGGDMTAWMERWSETLYDSLQDDGFDALVMEIERFVSQVATDAVQKWNEVAP